MHANTFDQYRHHHTIIHTLDPRVKVVITGLFIISNALLPDGAWGGFLTAWLLVIAIGWMGQITAVYTLKRSLIIIPFMLAAITVIFTLPGEPVISWQLGTRVVTISDAGLIRFASIFIRSWLSVQIAILLTAVTPFPDLMHALRHLRVPHILVSIISFMYRYLFVLADEAMRLLHAREARSARLEAKSGGSVTWHAKVAGSMVGQLLIRSLDRSDRVYQAMLSRGYDGRLLTLNPHQMGSKDWLVGGIVTVLIGLIHLIGRLH
jgi:cobalt/nickel transport system permease protein